MGAGECSLPCHHGANPGTLCIRCGRDGQGGAARAAKYAEKKLAKLTIDISNQKAKVKREECVQADQELLQKLIQDRKEYKEAPHQTSLSHNIIKPHYPITS